MKINFKMQYNDIHYFVGLIVTEYCDDCTQTKIQEYILKNIKVFVSCNTFFELVVDNRRCLCISVNGILYKAFHEFEFTDDDDIDYIVIDNPMYGFTTHEINKVDDFYMEIFNGCGV